MIQSKGDAAATPNKKRKAMDEFAGEKLSDVNSALTRMDTGLSAEVKRLAFLIQNQTALIKTMGNRLQKLETLVSW